MIYIYAVIYAVLLIVNIGSGIVAFIAGDYELLRHNVTVMLLTSILITLETRNDK